MYLKEFRERVGLSQKEIAEKLDVDKTNIGRYERDEVKPTSTAIEKYINVFNANPNYLFLGIEPHILDEISNGDRETNSEINSLVNELNILMSQDDLTMRLRRMLLEEILKKFDNPKIVELYFGHDDYGSRLSWGERIKDKKSQEIEKLENELLKKNYFLLEKDFLEELKNYEALFSSYIEKDSKFFRARIGYKEEYEKQTLSWNYTDSNGKKGYIPYKNEEIGAPPIIYTNQGRLNRSNVSFLYLATDIPTTIAEVRPHPGHKISIGCFYAKENIKVVDFDKAFIQLSQNEESLEKFIFLNHIDRLLSMPLTPEERTMYLITQFFLIYLEN